MAQGYIEETQGTGGSHSQLPKKGKSQKAKKERPPKVDLSRPSLAWPTLLLSVGCVAGWAILGWCFAQGWLSWWLTALLMAPISFAAFTPMHDASHRSVGRTKWLNEVIGRVCSVFLLAPFPAFRWIHLEHHKHTNDPHKDPDYWTSRPFLLFRWMTLDLNYYVLYIKAGAKRPLAERMETWISFAILWGAAATCLVFAPVATLALWVLPSRLAIVCLALFFDYLPHVPHHTTSSEDRYRATNIIRGPHLLLTPVLLYQNYHLIHHLYPGVPFYRYAKIWFTQRDFLLRHGVQEVSLLGAPSTHPEEET